jgi:hypothetical protein
MLEDIFTLSQLSLFIKDIDTTIGTRQYLINEHIKEGALTTDEEKLLGLYDLNIKKEEELNSFIQLRVVLTNAWSQRKKMETVESN